MRLSILRRLARARSPQIMDAAELHKVCVELEELELIRPVDDLPPRNATGREITELGRNYVENL